MYACFNLAEIRTRIRSLNANTSIEFGVNLTKSSILLIKQGRTTVIVIVIFNEEAHSVKLIISGALDKYTI